MKSDDVPVVPVGTYTVAFKSSTTRVYPLTWAQQAMLWMMPWTAPDGRSNPWVAADVQGADVPAVLNAIRAVVERHDALRARYDHADDGRYRQRVVGEGEIDIYEYDAGECPVEPVREAVAVRLASRGFGPDDLPVRAGLITRYGEPALAVLAFAHLAADALSAAFVALEVGRLTADPCAPLLECRQLADLLAYEHSENGRRQAERAADYWREQLWRAPNTIFPLSAVPRPDGAVPPAQMHGAVLDSKAAAAAVLTLGTRHGVSDAAVILAAFAVLVGAVAGRDECTFNLTSANRLDARARATVGNLFQFVPATVYISGWFRDLARESMAAYMRAFRFGRYDPELVARVREEVTYERGWRADLSCAVNFVGHMSRSVRSPYGPGSEAAQPSLLSHAGTTPEEIERLTAETTVRSLDPDQQPPAGLALSVWWLGENAIITLSGNARVFGRQQVPDLLASLERILVSACRADSEATVDELSRLVDLGQGRRCTDLTFVDRCWVDLQAVRELIERAIRPRVVRVFRTGGDSATECARLEAYVVDEVRSHTTEAIHAACVAALNRDRFVVVPQWYVVCAKPPSDLDSLSAWRSMPVLSAGSGRSGSPPFRQCTH